MASTTSTCGRMAGAAVALVAALTACSGGSAKVGAGAGPQVPAQAAQALRTCMSAAGFTQFEAGTVGAPGQDPIWEDEKFSAAYHRCEVESGILNFAPKDAHQDVDVKAVNKQNAAMVSCVRSRGWQVPDPQQGEKGILIPRFPQLAPGEQQAAFNKDLQSCGQVVGIGVDASGAATGGGAGGSGTHTSSAPR